MKKTQQRNAHASSRRMLPHAKSCMPRVATSSVVAGAFASCCRCGPSARLAEAADHASRCQRAERGPAEQLTASSCPSRRPRNSRKLLASSQASERLDCKIR
eukprot:356348-Chlamydomonas_euryale.AAC.11